jgi:hypothetical protein
MRLVTARSWVRFLQVPLLCYCIQLASAMPVPKVKIKGNSLSTFKKINFQIFECAYCFTLFSFTAGKGLSCFRSKKNMIFPKHKTRISKKIRAIRWCRWGKVLFSGGARCMCMLNILRWLNTKQSNRKLYFQRKFHPFARQSRRRLSPPSSSTRGTEATASTSRRRSSRRGR